MQDPEIKAAIDLLFSGYFNFGEPNIFEPIRDTFFLRGDGYLHMADLRSYTDAQNKIMATYSKPAEWNRMAIMNVAKAGKFSSDRTIGQYAKEIWNVKPISVPRQVDGDDSLL